MWFMTGKVDDEPLRILDDAAKTKSGFSAAFLLPDTRDVLEEREALAQAQVHSSNLQLIEADVRKHEKALTDVFSWLQSSSTEHQSKLLARTWGA